MWKEVPQKTGPAAWPSTGWLFHEHIVSFHLHVVCLFVLALNVVPYVETPKVGCVATICHFSVQSVLK